MRSTPALALRASAVPGTSDGGFRYLEDPSRGLGPEALSDGVQDLSGSGGWAAEPVEGARNVESRICDGRPGSRNPE